MRFTVRDILALTFIAALAAMAWTMTKEKNRLQEEFVNSTIELQNGTAMLETRQKQAEFAQAEFDWFVAKHKVTAAAVAHFPKTQAKYGRLEPRGVNSVSIRSVPMIVDEEYDDNNWRMRFWVPDGKVMHLKFGVAKKTSLWQSIRENDWLKSSPFDQSGPFEMECSAGIHDVDVASRKTPREQWQQFRLSVDNRPILVTTFQLDGVSGASGEWPSALERIDFPITRPYPLYQSRLRSSDNPQAAYVFRVWLENTSSGFAEFPKAAIRAASGARP